MNAPDLVVFGQITIDDVVPARPGPWQRRLGGNALYAAAGARMILPEYRIGVVSRVGRDMPFDVADLLNRAGVQTAIARLDREHLIEWLIYEEDGSRRSLPRNPALRSPRGEHGNEYARYLDHLAAQSPDIDDLPDGWRDAKGYHLAPQVAARHRRTLAGVGGNAFVAVDPSPHYSTDMTAGELAETLRNASAVLPSEQEVRRLLAEATSDADPFLSVAGSLRDAGIREVVIKAGVRGCVVASRDGVSWVNAHPINDAVDPTGAGDAFCGAFAAARILGKNPVEAAKLAVRAGAAIVQTTGAEAALDLPPLGSF